VIGIVIASASTSVAWAQTTLVRTDQQLTLKPWADGSFGETYDRILQQRQGHVKDAAPGLDDDTHVFFWDSTGRFRFSKHDDRAPAIAYRWATMSFDNESGQIPDHLDDIDLAGGLHVGELFGGELGLVGGVGYSGNSPFGNSHGFYGIGHITWLRPLSDTDALAITLDYNGNRALLPDAPLPGFAYVHRSPPLVEWGVGYPDSWIALRPGRFTLSAEYSAPYTADVRVEYNLTTTFSVFAGCGNFFNAFAFDDEPVTDRVFFQMSRAELGLRYNGKVSGFDVDAALTFGYAFEQNFYSGYDVRDLERFSSISGEPYVGIVLVGRY
jgi:hypothetical protein